MTCESSWKLLVIIAWEATTVARIAITRDGKSIPGGTVLKKGFVKAVSVVSLLI
jgi:hypothetical protein